MESVEEITLDRYVFYSVLALILGIFSGWYSGKIQAYLFIGILLFLFRKKKTYILLIVLFFIIGNCYTVYFLNNLVDKNINKESKEIIIRIEGQKGKSYIGKILNSEENALFKRKILFFYPNKLETGSIYQGSFIMSDFEVQRIPLGFNERMYYFSNNIFYKASVKKLESKKGNIYSHCLKYREEVMTKYSERYTDKAQGLVQAIIFGDKSLFSEETRNCFQLLGISHLLAVSGLHGGIIAAGAYRLFSPGGFYFKNLAAWVFLALYAFLAGFSPSINRAALMFFIFSLGKIFLRHRDPLTIITTSAFFQILFNPFVVFSAGFQLSYITVIGIILFHKNKKSNLSLSLAAVVGTVPIILLYFNKISIIGVVINLFYVPLFAIITLLAMLGLFLPFIPLGSFLNPFLNLIIDGTEKIASYFQFLDINISTPALWEIVLYYLLIFFIYNKRVVKRKALVFLLTFLVIFSFYPKRWEIVFLDVGQGDSAFISTFNEKIIVIDGGPWGNEVDSFLSSKGINKPDLYVLSHADSDHINGIIWLMETKPPKNLLLAANSESNDLWDQLIARAKEKKVNIIYGYSGQKFYIDGIKFEILSPSPSQRFTTCNDHSLVILVNYGDKNVLFTGDIEREILDNLKLKGSIDLLKAPHHGSNTGIAKEFFKDLKIDTGVISCGKNNRYGHPGKEFLDLLKEERIKIIRTDLKGTVSFIYRGKKEFYYKTVLD